MSTILDPKAAPPRALAKLFVDEAGTKGIRTGENGGTVITMVASTASQDRDGEHIAIEGWKWSEAPLPKLLWSHQYGGGPSTVIGRLTRVWKEARGLMIEAELADAVEGHADAKLVAGLMRDGFLDQGSVGFMPLEWKDPDGKTYTRENPGSYWGAMPGRTYTKVELLEFSIVAVPSQRDSILEQVRSLFSPTASSGDGTAAPNREIKDDARPKESGSAATVPASPVEDDWLTRFFRAKPPGALLSREDEDRLTKARDAINALLASATPAESGTTEGT